MRKVASFLRLMTGLAYMAVAGGLFFVVCLFLLPSRRLRVGATNIFGHVTGRFCLWITGQRVNPGVAAKMAAQWPAIYISNHASITDLWIAMMCCPTFTCGMAKKEIVYYPFLGQLYWISGHLRVDRSNKLGAMKALMKTGKMVKDHGLGMWIWAEGTRSRDGRLQDLKKGFALMALATRLPIVPVVVKGAHKGWKKDELLFESCDLDVEVLPPVPTTDWSNDVLDERIAAIHASMNAVLPDDQKGPPMNVEPRAARKRGKRAPVASTPVGGDAAVDAAADASVADPAAAPA